MLRFTSTLPSATPKAAPVGEQLVACCSVSWDQSTACATSPTGLTTSEGKLRHLCQPAVPRRSTLSYANAHRPSALFEDHFYRMPEVARGQAQQSGVRHKFRFKNKLLSIDATTIEPCASVFDWAQFRRTKGAVKLHLMLDHDGLLPCFGVIPNNMKPAAAAIAANDAGLHLTWTAEPLDKSDEARCLNSIWG
jgi:hypothetical protein